MRPKLQIALDVENVQRAKEILAADVLEQIDIVEVGTLLLAFEGKRAVGEIRKHIGGDKLLVADFKIADGASVLASAFLDEGADLTTIIAAANTVSMEKGVIEAKKRGKELQIELYGRWDMELAKQWYDLGIHHIIFHHARDGKHDWNAEDVNTVKSLCGIGFNVSVTGGINPETVQLFKGIPVYAFIAGRSLYEADCVSDAVSRFQGAITAAYEQ